MFAVATDAGAGVTSLLLESQPGDYVLRGERRFFWSDDAAFIKSYQQPAGRISFEIRVYGSVDVWGLRFASADGSPLAVGTYTNVERVGNQAPSQPGLDVSGEGAGCSSLSGNFTVLELSYSADTTVQTFRARFEQLCGGSTAPLRGEIRYDADVPMMFFATSLVKGIYGQPLSTDVSVQNQQEGPVALTALGLPPGASFSASGNRGTLRWTPTVTQAGAHMVGFRGQNALGIIDTVYIRIVVAPANDDIENAQVIQTASAASVFHGSNFGATSQFGEYLSYHQRTVWFKLTATHTERLVVTAQGGLPIAYQDPTPGTGPTFGELVRVAEPRAAHYDDDPRVVFETTAGGVYYIALSNQNGGYYTLQWRRAELTRLLWQHTSGAYAVWTVDGAGSVAFSPVFGPYPGWEAVRLDIGRDRQTRLLWRNTSGQASIWTLNASGQVVHNPVYGPFAGWTASDLATDVDGRIHVAWTHANGALRLWQMPYDAKQIWSAVTYGPYAGWSPSGLTIDGTTSRRIAWQNGATFGLWSETNPGYPTVDAIYGPFTDWTLEGLTARGEDQDLRLLWHHTSGAIGLWRLVHGGGMDMRVLGPYPGWHATGFAVSNAAPSFNDVYPRILWRHTSGMIAVWRTSEAVDSFTGLTFGPYPGWTVIDMAVGPE